MTKDEAIKLYDSKFWEAMTMEDRAMFQLWEDRMCMPFDVFHEAIQKTLKRSVWTHELALNRDGLKEEMLGLRPTPSIDDITNLIPEEKRIIVKNGFG